MFDLSFGIFLTTKIAPDFVFTSEVTFFGDFNLDESDFVYWLDDAVS